MSGVDELPFEFQVRPLAATDSLVNVLAVLNRASAARHYPILVPQIEDDVRAAIAGGSCFVAVHRALCIGVVTYHRETRWIRSAYLRQLHVGVIRHIAVDPIAQRRGVGTMLLSCAEETARIDGAGELAIVIPDAAVEIIDFFERREYRLVEETDATQPLFSSVIYSKWLGS